MKKRNVIIGGLLSFALTASLVGCDSTSATNATKDKGPKKLTNVGMTLMTLNNPYFVAMKKSLDEQAQIEGFKDTVVGADLDLSKQQAQIEDFIQKKVDLIIVNAVDSKGIAGAVQEAVQAHIPVIAVDVTADGGSTATVMSDNFTAGKLAGEYLAKRLNGNGNVVIVNGTPISSIFDRVDGFKEALKAYPNIKIISEDQNGKLSRDESNKVMENLLTAHPKGQINAVFGVNDPTAIGAYLAAKSANRNEIFFVGVDGSQAAVDILKKDNTFGETSAQHPDQEIVKAVELGKQLMEGKKLDSKTPYLVPVDPITKDNVDKYTPWG
ncbi:MAG TPA: substrate-binding domain-containing protein [Bacillales bacterium]|nr:substrate-binding domain-containing protein [Bacillales bacterium]